MNVNDPEAGSARALFERAVHGIDPATANRLRLARRAALARDSRRGEVARAWPRAAVVAAALLALGLAWWLPTRESVPPAVAVSPASTAPALVIDEAVLAAEDGEQEIYAWLAEAPVAAESEQAL